MTHPFPAADDIGSFVHLGNKSRDLLWIILEIGVHRDDDFAFGRLEARGKGRRLAKIAAEPNASEIGMNRDQ
jgi:hypothetical protein